MNSRIGIYSGTFNPVHSGHLSFALQSIEAAKLDLVYFLPERYRAGKTDVAHFGHRVAMLRQAIAPHSKLGLIESQEITFSIEKSLPKLERRFKGDQLVFLLGSDSLKTMPNWPKVDHLLKKSELVVGIRAGDAKNVISAASNLPSKPKQLFLVDSFAPHVSSTKIRDALRQSQETDGILSSVRSYSNRNWLYISLV